MDLAYRTVVAVLSYFKAFEVKLRFDEPLRLTLTLLVNGNELAVIFIPPLPPLPRGNAPLIQV